MTAEALKELQAEAANDRERMSLAKKIVAGKSDAQVMLLFAIYVAPKACIDLAPGQSTVTVRDMRSILEALVTVGTLCQDCFKEVEGDSPHPYLCNDCYRDAEDSHDITVEIIRQQDEEHYSRLAEMIEDTE